MLAMPIMSPVSYVRLWIPGPLPSLNELIAAAKSPRGYKYARLKKDWGSVISGIASKENIKDKFYRAHFTFLWCEKTWRRDPDNIAASGRKLILDGLVESGLLAGDGPACIAYWTDTFRYGDPRNGVEVEIFREVNYTEK